jgi:hypothetical protein
MKFNRRQLLAGAAALGMMPRKAEAWFPHGGGGIPIGHGWNTLPLGCGGLVTGFNIASDGTMVCRTDVGNVYRFSGTTASVTDPTKNWVPLLTYASMVGVGSTPGDNIGGYELVIAPNLTSTLYGIFTDFAGSGTVYWLYISTNSGAIWAKTSLSMLNCGSNTSWKNAAQKVAVDPNNSSVVYCGMPKTSGNSYGVYRAIDVVTFNPITTMAVPTIGPGSCGIVFDTNYSPATTTVSSQVRTSRVLIPVGGVGIYESLDGGQTFSEVFTATLGSATFAVFQGYLDYSGVYYCQMNYNNGNGYIWRYSGASGSWLQLDAQSGWPLSAGWLGNQGVLIVDPRSGHQGSVSATGPNGFGAGYTSANANSATGSSITWSGRTGGETPVQTAPSYDVSWLNHGTQGLNAFLQSTTVIIDSSGVCWWSGAQGFWHTTAIPSYGTNGSITSVCVARGMEATVAQDVCSAPGATYPTMAAQDVGILQGTFTAFPTDYYVSQGRMDCENLEYSASDPSFYVAKVDVEAAAAATGAKSAYSTNYGATGSWTPYTNMPDLMYQGSVTGYIDNGSGSSGTVLHVTAVGSGNVLPGQEVYSGSTDLGTITAQTGGTTYGIGTYTINTAHLTTSAALSLSFATESGVIVAVDHDHHVCVPSGYNGSFIPVYTANATSSCTWGFCSGLPQQQWTGRSFIYGPTSKPFAVGYGSDLGTVWAVGWVSGNATATIYKSTNSGASFSSVGTVTISVDAVGIFLLSVPGFPGELWLTGCYTGGSDTALAHSSDGGATWATVSAPSGQYATQQLTLGAPSSLGGYPTLYGLFNAGYGTTVYLYQGTYPGSGSTVTWSLFGSTGTQKDLPKSCQVAGFQSIRGDWNVYQRLYVASGQSGFAYYNP